MGIVIIHFPSHQFLLIFSFINSIEIHNWRSFKKICQKRKSSDAPVDLLVQVCCAVSNEIKNQLELSFIGFNFDSLSVIVVRVCCMKFLFAFHVCKYNAFYFHNISIRIYFVYTGYLIDLKTKSFASGCFFFFRSLHFVEFNGYFERRFSCS